MSSATPKGLRFCAVPLCDHELQVIEQTVRAYPGLSRTELAATLCELLGWLRANGKPQTVECRQLLEQLERQQVLRLPPPRAGRPKGTATRVAAPRGDSLSASITVPLRSLGPITLERVCSPEASERWRSLVEHYHYLGHRTPFGAHLRYLIQAGERVLGCIQFFSPAWRLRARDRWIGWDEPQRRLALQHIVCNGRFLILPWVQVPHLASHVLARAARRPRSDWHEAYGVRPWLLETLVDLQRNAGTRYRAANWIAVGATSGRGRDDRHHQRQGLASKQLWLYPLCPDARQRLIRGR